QKAHRHYLLNRIPCNAAWMQRAQPKHPNAWKLTARRNAPTVLRLQTHQPPDDPETNHAVISVY
ncbi:MAG: hypothetical protein ACREIP_04915, partial [Alphaproteobacteria bacterium]